MRFVPVKTAEQQAALMLHRTRDLLIRQQTALINSIRAHLAEFGLIEAQACTKAILTAIVMTKRMAYTGCCPSGFEDNRQPHRTYPDTDCWS